MDNLSSYFKKYTSFLITGGAGFIGSHICEKLVYMGFNVRCLDNLSFGKLNNINHLLSYSNFEFIEGDIQDIDICNKSCKDITYVLHQAALGSVANSIENPLEYERSNIYGTLNIFESSRHNNVKRVVYASSSSVYGNSDILPQTEGFESHVLSPYALTKKACEEYARIYQELYSIGTIGLRYFNIFGERQDPNGNYAAVIPKFIISAINNQNATIYGDGTTTRDFTYVENVVEANIRACIAQEDALGSVFNIGCGKGCSLNQLHRLIQEFTNSNLSPNYAPMRNGDIIHSYANVEKAEQLLKYKHDVDLHNGLEKTIKWFLKEEKSKKDLKS